MADTWRLVDRFNSSYYSGLDIRLYIGTVLITDVAGVTFEVRENVMPVYGYASYRYNKVIRGSRIIQGQFTIHFKKPYWLIEEIRRAVATGGGQGYVVDNEIHTRAASYSDVQAWINQQRARIWGEEAMSGSIGGKNEPLWDGSGLNMRLRYNDPHVARKRLMVVAADSSYSISPEPNAPDRPLSSFDEVLIDIQITSASKAYDDSGRSLMESYTFIARDYAVMLKHTG